MQNFERLDRVVKWGAPLLTVLLAAAPLLAEQPLPKPAPQPGAPNAAPALQGPPAAGDIRRACQFGYESGQVARREGRLLDARRYLTQCSQSYCPAFVRADCADWYNESVAMTPTVVIQGRSANGDEVNVKVTLDGQVVATQLDGKPLDLDPGVHHFRFERAPWPPVEQKILLAAGVKGRLLTVNFGSEQAGSGAAAAGDVSPSASSSPGLPTASYVLGGAGLLLAANALYWGVGGLSDKSSLTSTCQPHCSSEQIDDVKTKFLIADLSAGAAAIAVGLAIYVYAAQPANPLRSTKPEVARSSTPQLSVQPLPQGAMLGIVGTL
jgi:hypothetical protein